ncbi:MAG: type II toxin-antitoxin system VapC family toxin [Nocardioides sp.]
MATVCDASVVVAALMGDNETGRWAESILSADGLVGPHHLPAEVFGVLRRMWSSGALPEEVVSQGVTATLALNVRLVAFEPYAARVWELRGSVTGYDAWYVALAESLDAPLATLDRRLTRAPGPRCEFVVPNW